MFSVAAVPVAVAAVVVVAAAAAAAVDGVVAAAGFVGSRNRKQGLSAAPCSTYFYHVI